MNPFTEPARYAELTVEQLIADEPSGEPLGARFDAIRTDAADGGITVTVDLHGKIVGLRLDHEAMRLPAHELAARIKAVAERAATAALAIGMAVLSEAAGDAIAAALSTDAGARRAN